jgi:hypothetical protein
MLVTLHVSHLTDELMSPHSAMIVEGIPPDPDYWYGGTLIVTGRITSAPDTLRMDDIDTLSITITASSYEYICEGLYDPDMLKDNRGPEEELDDILHPDDCDSCKFAILVSSVDDRWRFRGRKQKRTYWENLVNLRRHKIDNEGYCSTNVYVHIGDGTSRNVNEIPASAVHPCTVDSIEATHRQIAQKIAEKCKGKATVQKMFTDHGSDDKGVCVLKRQNNKWYWDYLSPKKLRELQQILIDSCCKNLYDEFLTCYGGDMLDSLKNLNDKKKTEIHANSAAPRDEAGCSPSTGGHHYLNKKIASLAAGKHYEEAVLDAEKEYMRYLDTLIAKLIEEIEMQTDVASQPEIDEKVRDSLQEQINKKIAKGQRLQHARQSNSPSWVRYQFKKYCEKKEVAVQKGGQLKIEFKGTGGCANVTLWEKQADGTWKRVKVWNWNLPGSAGFTSGNDVRVHNVDSSSTGVFKIHNDDSAFTATAESFCDRPEPDEDPSNAYTFAGFSVGWNDSSNTEFGPIFSEYYTSDGTDDIGFNLDSVPEVLDPWEGVKYYTALFTPDGYNEWWDDMELYLNVLFVWRPGDLYITCPTAEFQTAAVYIDTAGEYLVHLGAIDVDAPDPGEIVFDASAVSFGWDSWALRTRVPTESEYYCGMYTDGYTGNTNCDDQGRRNLADITRLIDFVYISQEPLCNDFEGNTSGDSEGRINLADITRLIDFVYISQLETAACP